NQLVAETLPAIVQSGDNRTTIAALEMVESWRRVIDLPELSQLVRHPSPEIRGPAIRLAPFAAARGNLDPAVAEALDDRDAGVRMAALDSAARMGLRSALPAIERAARDADDPVSRRACFVLASFGNEGQGVLEYFVVAGDRRVAAWAAEALAWS